MRSAAPRAEELDADRNAKGLQADFIVVYPIESEETLVEGGVRRRDDASSSTSVEPRTSSSSSGDEGEAGGRSPAKVARRGTA